MMGEGGDAAMVEPDGVAREDYAACCCAVHNLCLSLHAEGIGTKWYIHSLSQPGACHARARVHTHKHTRTHTHTHTHTHLRVTGPRGQSTSTRSSTRRLAFHTMNMWLELSGNAVELVCVCVCVHACV